MENKIKKKTINPTILFILVELVNDIKKRSENPKWTVDALYLSEYEERIQSEANRQKREVLEEICKVIDEANIIIANNTNIKIKVGASAN